MADRPDLPDLPDPADLPVVQGRPSDAHVETGTGERIGVYVCHCGGNISDVVDVDRVARELGQDEDVAVARHVMFMCSDEGQQSITDDIRDLRLDRVIVAACTPKLHETTFRKTVIRGGMNPYLFLPANIREQVSWAHPHDHEAATDKAIAVVKAAVAKARLLQPLEMVRVSAVHRTLVIGGGVAGLRSALDLARQGLEVVLIEASPFLGGRTAQLHTVYPTEEPARPLVRRLIDQVLAESHIDVRTSTQLVALSGYVGDFQATLRTEPRGVTSDLVDAASAFAACPVEVPDAFEQGLRTRKAIYRPYADAQPLLPAIDWASCTRCQACAVATGGQGIDLEAVTIDAIVDVGAVIVASGYDHYQPSDGEYGYGRSDRVITLPQLERMLDPEGPSGGRLLVDGRPPRTIAFIHCVGSRQIEGVDEPGPSGRLNAYCSRVCCTATLQAANEVRRRYPDTAVVDLYRDIRTYEKDQEAYYVEASKQGVVFLRFDDMSRPTVEAAPSGDAFPLLVRVTDTLTFGQEMEVPADLVVLAVGMEPRDISDVISLTKAPVGDDGFLLEVHPKLRPVESAIAGLLLAGAAQGPKDISESTSSASAAAAKAATILARDYVEMEPFVARVDLSKCTGTAACLDACRYANAISLREIEIEDGVMATRAYVNPVACKGCGACVAACPTGAIDVMGWEMDQYRAMIDAIGAQPLAIGGVR